MQHLVENLQFKAKIVFVSETSPCFKSVDYPPKSDFAMSIDQAGNVISRYGDGTWDFSSFGAKFKMQFGEFDEANKALFKQLIFYVLYSHLFPGSFNSLGNLYTSFQNIFRVCTKYKLDARNVQRFPKVVEEAAQAYAKDSPSSFSNSIYWLHVALKNQEHIGFLLLNEKNIVAYKRFDPAYEYGQTPYIPNRIWTMLIQQLDSVLDDFEANQNKLEALYHFLAKTTLLNEKRGVSKRASSPFNRSAAADKIIYSGTFDNYLQDNGLLELFEKYTKKYPSFGFDKGSRKHTTDQFGALLNNISLSCYLYVLFYSIMRKEEALSLRTDCLHVEVDERLGEFYLLAGETTKTDPDSDARWVVPKRIERAIEVAKTLVDWKLQYVQPPQETPHLFQNLSVWQVANRTSKVRSFHTFDKVIAKGASHFFNLPQHTITQADYDEALGLTPSLIRKEWFKVGNVWKFAWHQFRRTLAVHFAVNKVSVSSTQLQMKHGTREQQFHYQNNAGRLRLNRVSEQEVVTEYYAEMSRNIASVVNGERILPHTKSPVKDEVVRIVTDGDRKKLLKAQKNGLVGARENIIGWCMKQGECEFGGFTTIAPCTGGDGGNPCSDVVIDGAREQEFKDDMVYYENKMNEAPEGSPLHKAFKAEVHGYKNVLTIIEKKTRGA
jgi:hypothetical protein